MSQLKKHFHTEALFQSFAPKAALLPFIQEYWIMHLHKKAAHQKSELELPEIFPEIIFKYGVDYEETYVHNNAKKIQSSSTISGVSNYAKASKRTNTAKDLLLIGVKFKPRGLYSLLGIPLFEFYNQCIPLADIAHPFLNCLEEQLAELRTSEKILALLNQEFTLAFNKTHLDLIQTNFYQKIEHFNTKELNILRKDSTISYKKLERHFQKYIGINPKKLSKLLRFKSFYKDWVQAEDYKYIDLVYQHDYYDQNHLIKDFKSILNSSPSKFLKVMEGQFTQHITRANLS